MIWYPLQKTDSYKIQQKMLLQDMVSLQKTVSYKIQQKMLLYDMVSTIEDRELQNTTENVII